MLFSKKRIIHAVLYESILLLLMIIGLSLFMDKSMHSIGFVSIAMTLIAVFWNMIYNNLFERIESKFKWQRTIPFRVFHAIGFEAGLLFITVPMIAYFLNMSLWAAFILDISLCLFILVYTFFFQWCFDIVESKYLKKIFKI